MVFLWFSYGFPMVFPWFSCGFPMVFLWFSHGFPHVPHLQHRPVLWCRGQRSFAFGETDAAARGGSSGLGGLGGASAGGTCGCAVSDRGRRNGTWDIPVGYQRVCWLYIYIYIYIYNTQYTIYTTIHSINMYMYKYISMYMYMYNEIYLYIYTVYYVYIYSQI